MGGPGTKVWRELSRYLSHLDLDDLHAYGEDM